MDRAFAHLSTEKILQGNFWSKSIRENLPSHHAPAEILESLSNKRFCKNIRDVLLCIDLDNLNIAFLDFIFESMVLRGDVSSSRSDGFGGGENDATSVVLIDFRSFEAMR